MAKHAINNYQRCYISAPAGIQLGVLPEVLTDRGVSWEWARDTQSGAMDLTEAIRSADFAIVVLNGTIADYRAVFDAGLALGIRKPILLVRTHSRPLPIDLRWAPSVKAKLSNREALELHLDMFLASPHVSVPLEAGHRLRGTATPRPPIIKDEHKSLPFNSEVERRVYEAVKLAGGSAIVEPQASSETRYRPDLLAWLGNIDAEFLDPVVIAVSRKTNAKMARTLEERLMSFMQSTRVKLALVLTLSPPPERGQQLSASVLWLTIDDFEELARSGRLGQHIRDSRNRILHGVR